MAGGGELVLRVSSALYFSLMVTSHAVSLEPLPGSVGICGAEWGKMMISQLCPPASSGCWHLCTVWGSQLSLPSSAGGGKVQESQLHYLEAPPHLPAMLLALLFKASQPPLLGSSAMER